jgi:hypothetical protein
MERLHMWLDAQFDERRVEPNSGLGQAISYLLKHWNRLTLFLRQPGAPLDNNICERALKKSILHRKNSLFYKTRNGARIAEEVFTGKDDRILFTTFTKNLATDISQNLRKLCGDEKAWARIEVQHLDGWVANFLRTQGYRPDVVYDAENDCWRNALEQAPEQAGLPERFLPCGVGERSPSAEHYQRR